MEADGNLLDALTIAARAALLSLKCVFSHFLLVLLSTSLFLHSFVGCRLPALKLVPGDGGTTDIEIPDEASMNTPSVKRFDAVNPSRVPISITLTKVRLFLELSSSRAHFLTDCRTSPVLG